MKKVHLLPFILALSLPLTGCDFKKKPSGGGEGGGGGGNEPQGEVTFDSLKNEIILNHNYTFEVESYYQNYPEERFDGVYYSLDNEVFYGTDPAYPSLWVKGYSRIKDQGIAEVYKGLNTDEIVIQNFVCTNPDLYLMDVDGEMLEYIFSAPMSKVSDDHYRVYQQSIVGIVGTYSGLELAYISNPEYIDLVRTGDTILITSILSANYYDPETLEPVENEPVYVGLKVKNVGSTANALFTNFARAESSKVAPVTAWDEEITADFNEYYGGYVPPFINGLGYSFYHATEWNGYEQRYDIMAQDFTSGDLRQSYGQQLVGAGFSLTDFGYYEKIVSKQGGALIERYRVEMNYVSPSSPYGSKTFGYYFPMGNFQITYSMKTEVVMTVDTVAKFNEYLETTAAKVMAPRLPETGPFSSAEVTHFTDSTEVANQLGGDWLFLTSSTTYFRIYIPQYEDAVDFYNEFLSSCEDKGFDHVESMALFHLSFITDEADSKITVDYVPSFTKADYEKVGYIQCQYGIRNNYTKTYAFDLNKDKGVESIHRISPTNYLILPGTKVTFSFDLKAGFAFDELVCNDTTLEITKESGENTYSFIMPAKAVNIDIVTKSAASGIEFEKSYFVYINNDDYTESRTRVEGHTSQYLEMIFHESGTMTYKRTRYTPSGAVHSGPYSMTVNFTLIDGQLTLLYISGDNSDFDKWRLFDTNTEGAGNDTGTFADGVITIKVVDSNSNLRTIHLELGD